MNLLHTIAVLTHIAAEEQEDCRIQSDSAAPQDTEAWGVKFARKRPRLFALFSLFVALGLVVFILIAILEYLL